MATEPLPTAAVAAMRHRQLAKSTEILMGMVTGMVADAHLHDMEIKLLSTWLTENAQVAEQWPGSVIARKVREVMADGVITQEERAHLLEVLQGLAANDFSATGAAVAEVATLPINDAAPIEIVNAGVCHTGVFLFGTRSACERLTEKAGGLPVDNVTKKTAVLVVGTKVSPDWAHTSFGRKIQRAAELQEEGHRIEIISERRWLEVVGGQQKGIPVCQ